MKKNTKRLSLSIQWEANSLSVIHLETSTILRNENRPGEYSQRKTLVLVIFWF